MKTKTIVKVMNFHALLRVDKSRKIADNYQRLDEEIYKVLDMVTNNKNLILDKKSLKVKKKNPKLKIYIGSDLGFCGSINSSVNNTILKNQKEKKIESILIGRKLKKDDSNILTMSKDAFNTEYEKIYNIIRDAVAKNKYSEISLIYNHYYNVTTILPIEKVIFPLEKKFSETEYNGDIVVDDYDENIISELLVSFLNYEIKIAYLNSLASENVLRQNSTNESLKKIEEKETEEAYSIRRKMNYFKFKKVIANYISSLRKEV